jgi:hypothetical protein
LGRDLVGLQRLGSACNLAHIRMPDEDAFQASCYNDRPDIVIIEAELELVVQLPGAPV